MQTFPKSGGISWDVIGVCPDMDYAPPYGSFSGKHGDILLPLHFYWILQQMIPLGVLDVVIFSYPFNLVANWVVFHLFLTKTQTYVFITAHVTDSMSCLLSIWYFFVVNLSEMNCSLSCRVTINIQTPQTQLEFYSVTMRLFIFRILICLYYILYI